MTIELEFVGAAREVTGSCHLLHVGGRTVMLDCGLFQGRRREAAEKNRHLPLPVDRIDAIVLSHAHLDHAGRLPLLAKCGYQGTIWCTAATRDLAAVMLADSAHIQEQDAEFLARRQREAIPAEPLYTMRDAARVADLMIGLPYGREFDVIPGVRARLVDAGHILGSASVVLDCTDDHGATTRVVFSGDIGRSGLSIIRDPVPPEGAQAVIMESTYGNRDHESVANARAHLARVVRETAARGGRVLVPAFALGRTQEIVYALHELRRAGEIPAIPIYIDSPLAIETTSVFAMHPEVFDRTEQLVQTVQQLFEFELVHYTRTVEESKAIDRSHGPAIIISASGMVEAGRILHHLAHGAPDPRNTVLIVGFQAEHTLGRRIVERQPVLKIFGDDVPLRAHVEVLDGYSAHADRTQLLQWIEQVRTSSPALGPVCLVHGEPDAQEAFATLLGEHGFRDVQVPAPGTRLPIRP